MSQNNKFKNIKFADIYFQKYIFTISKFISRNIIFKLYKKYIYSKVKNFRIHTVSVRGRLSIINQEFKNNHGPKYIYNIKQINKWLSIKSDLENKIILEIGFGDGEHLLSLAKENIKAKIVGVELYDVGIVLAAKKIHKENIKNVKLIQIDAREFIENINLKFDKIYVLFPDPWRKVRHNKRRLVKEGFINNLLEILSINGELVIATDWQEYSDEIEVALNNILKLNAKFVLKKYFYPKNILDKDIIENKEILSTAFARRAFREGRDISTFNLSGC